MLLLFFLRQFGFIYFDLQIDLSASSI
jgi:hypothetical protein